MEQVRTFTSSVLDPHQRGVEFGEHHGAQIVSTVAAYRRLFAARAIRPFDVDAWGERAWERIGELTPAAAEEIRGIAEGSGIPVREVSALNARTELLAIADPTGLGECSTVVSLPPGRPPVAVQTWDWCAAMAGDWLHWTIPYPDGRVVRTVTEYGMLAKIGVSSCGLGVLLNMLHHVDDGSEEVGYPVHLLSRRILETCGSMAEALDAARSVDTSASTSLTVVEGDAAVSIELFPRGSDTVEPVDGLLVRTNHFVSPQGAPGCIASKIGPGSEIRRTTLLEAYAGHLPATADEAFAAMRDHAEVGGVCVHPDPAAAPVLQHATLATVSVDIVGQRLDIRAGGPCEGGSPGPRT